jgi:hypothetical protein
MKGCPKPQLRVTKTPYGTGVRMKFYWFYIIVEPHVYPERHPAGKIDKDKEGRIGSKVANNPLIS